MTDKLIDKKYVPSSQRKPVTLIGQGLQVNPPVTERHSAPLRHGLLTQ